MSKEPEGRITNICSSEGVRSTDRCVYHYKKKDTCSSEGVRSTDRCVYHYKKKGYVQQRESAKHEALRVSL